MLFAVAILLCACESAGPSVDSSDKDETTLEPFTCEGGETITVTAPEGGVEYDWSAAQDFLVAGGILGSTDDNTIQVTCPACDEPGETAWSITVVVTDADGGEQWAYATITETCPVP